MRPYLEECYIWDCVIKYKCQRKKITTMKNLVILMICLLTVSTFSQEKKSKNEKATISVSGNCEHCQQRIVKTALSQKGVKYASWDAPSNQLSLIFNAHKIDLQDIHQAISLSGHDTNQMTAPQEVYDQVPECCKYERLSGNP